MLCLSLPAFAQEAPSEAVDQVMIDLGKFSAWTPRLEGSRAEQQTIDYISDQWTALGLTFRLRDFSGLTNGHSFSQTMEADLPASGQTTDTLILAASLDQDEAARGHGAGSLNLALLMSAARWFKNHPPGLNLKFLVLGAEKGPGDRYPMGSRQFLGDYYQAGRTAILYLDFDFIPKRLQIHTESGGVVCPIWLLRGVSESLQEADLNFLIHGNHPSIFRFNLPENRNLIDDWLRADIPGVLFRSDDETGQENNLGKWLPSFEYFLSTFVTRFGNSMPKTWDKHYLFFQVQNQFLILSQGNYLNVLLVAVAVFLALAFLRHRRLKASLEAILKSLWQIPVIFILLFFFLWLGTELIGLVLGERGFDSLWRLSPLVFLSLKVLLAVFAYYLIFYQLRRMPLSRWSGFYAYSSVFVLVLAVFISLYLELSFSFYFLWSLLFSFLFTMTNNKWLKVACLITAPFWFLKAALELFLIQPDLSLSEAALLSSMGGNLVITLILFPFFLMMSSYHFIAHQRPERNEKLYATLVSLTLGTAILGVVSWAAVWNPFSAQNKAPLEILETVNGEARQRSLEVASPLSGPEVSFSLDQDRVKFKPSVRPATLPLPWQEGRLSTKVSGRSFLDRIFWTITLEPADQPENLEIELEAPGDLVIYSCNFPTAIAKEGTTARIHIGRFPPKKLEIQLTLGGQTDAKFNLRYIYSRHPGQWKLESELFRAVPSLLVTGTLRLNGPALRGSLPSELATQLGK